MKKCRKCGKQKSLTEFHQNKTHKDGLQDHCKLCVKKHHRKWYQKNKKKVAKQTVAYRKRLTVKIQDVKRNLGCYFCVEHEPICLDFHHPNNDKSYEIANMIGRGLGWESIQEELKKCVCVCSNCHRKIHGGLLKVR